MKQSSKQPIKPTYQVNNKRYVSGKAAWFKKHKGKLPKDKPQQNK